MSTRATSAAAASGTARSWLRRPEIVIPAFVAVWAAAAAVYAAVFTY